MSVVKSFYIQHVYINNKRKNITRFNIYIYTYARVTFQYIHIDIYMHMNKKTKIIELSSYFEIIQSRFMWHKELNSSK